jgi:hypothetical protein
MTPIRTPPSVSQALTAPTASHSRACAQPAPADRTSPSSCRAQPTLAGYAQPYRAQPAQVMRYPRALVAPHPHSHVLPVHSQSRGRRTIVLALDQEEEERSFSRS